ATRLAWCPSTPGHGHLPLCNSANSDAPTALPESRLALQIPLRDRPQILPPRRQFHHGPLLPNSQSLGNLFLSILSPESLFTPTLVPCREQRRATKSSLQLLPTPPT
ncbi:hypothetical protein CLAIMM_13104, partial [Cladophialophora immunda]